MGRVCMNIVSLTYQHIVGKLILQILTQRENPEQPTTM